MDKIKETGDKSITISESSSDDNSLYEESESSAKSSSNFSSDDSYYDEVDDLNIMPFTDMEANEQLQQKDGILVLKESVIVSLQSKKLKQIFKLSAIVEHYLHKEKPFDFVKQLIMGFPCFKNNFNDLNKTQILQLCKKMKVKLYHRGHRLFK